MIGLSSALKMIICVVRQYIKDMQITEAILESNKDIYSKNQDWKSGQKLFARKLKLELL